MSGHTQVPGRAGGLCVWRSAQLRADARNPAQAIQGAESRDAEERRLRAGERAENG